MFEVKIKDKEYKFEHPNGHQQLEFTGFQERLLGLKDGKSKDTGVALEFHAYSRKLLIELNGGRDFKEEKDLLDLKTPEYNLLLKSLTKAFNAVEGDEEKN